MNKEYRFGFNGMEKDDEVTGQTGSVYTAMFWEYDARIGRRWNIDPMSAKYAWQSPYACFNNNPVYFVAPLGLEGDHDPVKKGDTFVDNSGNTKVVDCDEIIFKVPFAGRTIPKLVERTGAQKAHNRRSKLHQDENRKMRYMEQKDGISFSQDEGDSYGNRKKPNREDRSKGKITSETMDGLGFVDINLWGYRGTGEKKEDQIKNDDPRYLDEDMIIVRANTPYDSLIGEWPDSNKQEPETKKTKTYAKDTLYKVKHNSDYGVFRNKK